MQVNKRLFSFLLAFLLCATCAGCRKEPEEITVEQLYQRSVLMCEALDNAGEDGISLYVDPILGDTYTEFRLYNSAYTTLHDLGDYKDSADYFDRFSYNSYALVSVMSGYGYEEPRRFQKSVMSCLYDSYCNPAGFVIYDDSIMSWYINTFYDLHILPGQDMVGNLYLSGNDNQNSWFKQDFDGSTVLTHTENLQDGITVSSTDILSDGNEVMSTYCYDGTSMIQTYRLDDTVYSTIYCYNNGLLSSKTIQYDSQKISETYDYDDNGLLTSVRIIQDDTQTVYLCRYQGKRIVHISKIVRDSTRSLVSYDHCSFYYSEIIGYHNENKQELE